MNVIVIYPGRFHPFHRGHKASYDYLTQRFGDNAVYITTSDIQAPVTSPFTYADKVEMMTALGVPASHVVKVKQPYQPQEITNNLSAEEKATTALVIAVSEKDMAEGSARFKFGVKKNGEPTYLQPMPENVKQLKPMTKHAYVMVTPTVNFKVRGADANSASQIRQMYIQGTDADRDSIIADLYGEVVPRLRDTFDARLGTAERVQEFIYGTPIVDAGIKEPGIREHRQRVARLLEQVIILERRVQEAHDSDDIDMRGNLAMSPAAYRSMRRKQIDWAKKPASESPTARFTYQGFTIQFHPDRVEIYRGGDLVYSKAGNYAQPTKQQLSTVRGRIPALVSKLKQMMEDDSADYIEEKWSQKYKRSINCNRPQGFSQRAHCAGRKKK
jgi:Cytidylyltransferase-like